MDKILEWMSPTRWIILLVLLLTILVSLIAFGEKRYASGEAAATARYEAAIGKMQAEAATKLGAATRRALELERTVASMQADKEAENERRRIESRAASERLADAAAAHGGRLRDPNAERGGCGRSAAPEAAAGPSPGGDNAAETGGLLSGPLTRLLQRATDEAQQVNDAYAVCRDTMMLWKKQYDPPDGP